MKKRLDLRNPLGLSRREFLAQCGWASAGFLSAPLPGAALIGSPPFDSSRPGNVAPLAEYRLTPHYRVKSPLDDVIRNVRPGLDAFPTETYAEEILAIVKRWSEGLQQTPPNFQAIGESLSRAFVASTLQPAQEKLLRSDAALEVFRRRFSGQPSLGPEAFVRELAGSLSHLSNLLTAEFRVMSIKVDSTSPLVIKSGVRYDLVGSGPGAYREERVGVWDLEWEGNSNNELRVRKWQPLEETRSRASGPIFTDITSRALAGNSSYTQQMLRGMDYWRTVLDAACGIDIYGNNGVAAGDIDNDGCDDFYVCQPAGLPNRLYRNRGDGTFEDITEAAGVGVLDSTACALFADVNNDGHQDLLVVRATGPVLFLNQGNGRFRLKPDAFRFAQPPQGTFTSAAFADYDRDGWLDVYFCLYSYYQGLGQYQYPTPYYDAQNGPPNFLLHNERDGTFRDVTGPSGMNQNNNRYSFACSWCDFDDDGWPDLYVVNDFGRKNLYRNDGDGTFTDVAEEAGVVDVGPGMSACWFDYDLDGRQDLYVSDMWEAAGLRVSMQETFQKDAPADVRALLRRHAKGNSLFRNEGNGRFEDRSVFAGVEMTGWSWSCNAWDFDHDGFADLYIANGMISGPKTHDLEGFFWRQVVSHSPVGAATTQDYEQGWNAINELIRSDGTWAGYQRKVFYLNNRDGTFSYVAGVLGLDFLGDSRAFALADIDHDGRLEIILKSRTGPQLRILHNEMKDLGNSIAFRLHGRQSNRDAIGAAITVETEHGRQVKFLQAGSGFASQHTKEIFFGLGRTQTPVQAQVRWPNGLVQRFEGLPVNHRIVIEEASASFRAEPFRSTAPRATVPVAPQRPAPLPSGSETWLIDPLVAPDFSLPDLAGRVHTLKSFRGHPVLLNFWVMESPACQKELGTFQRFHAQWAAQGLRLVALNVNDPSEAEAVRVFARARGLSFLILLASQDVAAVYNVSYRYLFDRRRDLGFPTSFLVDEQGSIVKVYQGPLHPQRVLEDIGSIPRNVADRLKKALPFPANFYVGEFHRNYFSYGVAFFQRGYLDEAITAFQMALGQNPAYGEAYYNLGTIYLKKQMPTEAREHLQRAIQLRPNYPDALNNLGLVAAEEGRTDEAARCFQQAIRLKADYTIALQNLGNLYRRQGRWAEAQQFLERSLQARPDDPETYYSLGMLFAQQDDRDRAREYLQKALQIRPEYPEALNNLGVLYLRSGRPAEAAAEFHDCIRAAPTFDQAYLNLARVYAGTGEKQKAQKVLQELLRRHPDHPEAKKVLEQLTD